MKLGNGFGSVCKVKEKRRKPFRVYVTLGWDENGKQIKKSLGYVKSYIEGIVLLDNYHANPYNLDYKNITFGKIWETVNKRITSLVENGKMSLSNLNGLNNAFENHLTELHNIEISQIRKVKMQDIIDNAKQIKNTDKELGYSAKDYMVTVCQKVFTCAIDEYGLPIKNQAIGLTAGSKPTSDKHIPFTSDEISIFWGMQHNDLVKCMLILCYTGLRPNELFLTRSSNIYLDENYFITGSKTKAGKNRIVPIHPKIKHLIKYYYERDKDLPFVTVFNNFNYSKFSRECTKLMKDLNFAHTPYDARHTFITKMKQAGANEYLLKTIVGHSIKDLTENTYTHRNVIELYNEIIKIK